MTSSSSSLFAPTKTRETFRSRKAATALAAMSKPFQEKFSASPRLNSRTLNFVVCLSESRSISLNSLKIPGVKLKNFSSLWHDAGYERKASLNLGANRDDEVGLFREFKFHFMLFLGMRYGIKVFLIHSKFFRNCMNNLKPFAFENFTYKVCLGPKRYSMTKDHVKV